jgi:DNA mismatch endonuclease, patch repair protein
MSRVTKKDTRPEMAVWRLAHRLGYRFRLHRRDLPGTPDLVFTSRRKVIFVHGCFWHRHACQLAGRVPSVRADYWGPKLDRNVERDRATQAVLKEGGWRALTMWECEVRDEAALERRPRDFFDA